MECTQSYIYNASSTIATSTYSCISNIGSFMFLVLNFIVIMFIAYFIYKIIKR